jgi:2-haloacid dehalogenase
VGHLLDEVISIHALGHYKPRGTVYELIAQKMGVAPEQTCFVSSNGWDAAGAAKAGFRVLWVNRAGLPVDRLPYKPAAVLKDLRAVPDWV